MCYNFISHSGNDTNFVLRMFIHFLLKGAWDISFIPVQHFFFVVTTSLCIEKKGKDTELLCENPPIRQTAASAVRAYVGNGNGRKQCCCIALHSQ